MKRPLDNAVICFVLLATAACCAQMVQFVIPAQQNPGSLIAMHSQPIDVNDRRITVLGDKFVLNGQRIKIWGVNLSFGGNLPSPADAPVVAARLSAAGINAVRCHHLDTSAYPAGIWNPADGRTIYPGAMDRLDYFINELAKRGIYTNLNLHVGRAHSQYIGWPDPCTDYDKIVGIFTRALIDAQKNYAAQMLGHINPYRGVRYADDPAIAFVEISNEDSFFMWDGEEKLRGLPPYYADLLKYKYNTWLGNEYGDTNNLRAVWNANVETPGPNVITSFEEHFSNPAASRWVLEEHNGCDANFAPGTCDGNAAAKFTVLITDSTNWHLQVKHPNLQLTQGQYYTLSFKAVAEGPRSIFCSVMQDHTPWGNLGFSRTVNLTTQWQTFKFGFTANADDLNARVNIAFGGGDTTTFYLDDVELRTGGQTGLLDDEFIETHTVRLFVDTEVKERTIDRMRFLAETEKAYFDEMYAYIKNDLGYAGLVTGTIVFGPCGLYAQSDMDFIDSHAYWQHPVFPGQPWDPDDWYIQQKPMTDCINEATLFGLAAQRLGRSITYAGKPFTCSEYNHPAPLDTQASCVPMLTSFAAAQDWDGLWLYTYTHSQDDWYDNYFPSYFDVMHNPAKWGFITAGASIFRYGGLGPAGSTYSYVALTEADNALAGLAQLHLKHGSDMFSVLAEKAGITRQDLLNNRITHTLYQTGTVNDTNGPNNTALTWNVDANGRAIYTAVSPSAGVYVGHKSRFADATGNTVEVNEPNYVAITITSLDGVPLASPRQNTHSFLITACGRSENTGMIFSPDRTTVGTNWGTAPVLIEPVCATIRFAYKGLKCYALSPDGTISAAVPLRSENGGTVVEISPSYQTMWYLLTSSGDVSGDGKTDFEDLAAMAGHWSQNTNAVDIAPVPFGDGLVNYSDIEILTDAWLDGTAF